MHGLESKRVYIVTAQLKLHQLGSHQVTTWTTNKQHHQTQRSLSWQHATFKKKLKCDKYPPSPELYQVVTNPNWYGIIPKTCLHWLAGNFRYMQPYFGTTYWNMKNQRFGGQLEEIKKIEFPHLLFFNAANSETYCNQWIDKCKLKAKSQILYFSS